MMDIIQLPPEGGCVESAIRLVVCLGNPGIEYAETRHNAGFKVGDGILGRCSGVRSDWQPVNGELYEVRLASGRSFKLLKPMTYMNLSGDCVVGVTGHFGISPSEVLVVSDCLDLPFGRLRMRPSGSSGGQKGVRSILALLGTEAVPRLRVGIGRPQSSECDIVDYVLASWTSVERELLESSIVPACAEMVLKAIEEGVGAAMNVCNCWQADKNNAET